MFSIKCGKFAFHISCLMSYWGYLGNTFITLCVKNPTNFADIFLGLWLWVSGFLVEFLLATKTCAATLSTDHRARYYHSCFEHRILDFTEAMSGGMKQRAFNSFCGGVQIHNPTTCNWLLHGSHKLGLTEQWNINADNLKVYASEVICMET